jgi:hypothetical protein
LLGECLETYAELDEAQKERFRALLHTGQYPEVQSFMKTTYERGVESGIHQGERRAALLLLEAKFGPLSAEVKHKVEALSPEALAQFLLDLLKAQSLEELRLEDGSQAENTHCRKPTSAPHGSDRSDRFKQRPSPPDSA